MKKAVKPEEVTLEFKEEQNGWAVYRLSQISVNIREMHPEKSGPERSVRMTFDAPEGYGINIAIQLRGGAGPVPENTFQIISVSDIVDTIVRQASLSLAKTFEESKEKEW